MKAMKKLNEKEIIRIFRQKKNIAEDVELFHLGKELCAANIDTLVESTDIPAKSDLIDVARKSVVSSVSDFAAKGIIPKFCIISVTIPRTLSKNQITKMATGFRKACDEFDLEFLGGDWATLVRFLKKYENKGTLVWEARFAELSENKKIRLPLSKVSIFLNSEIGVLISGEDTW